LERETTSKEIFKYEQFIISTCEFELDMVSPIHYVDRYLKLMYPHHINTH